MAPAVLSGEMLGPEVVCTPFVQVWEGVEDSLPVFELGITHENWLEEVIDAFTPLEALTDSLFGGVVELRDPARAWPLTTEGLLEMMEHGNVDAFNTVPAFLEEMVPKYPHCMNLFKKMHYVCYAGGLILMNFATVLKETIADKKTSTSQKRHRRRNSQSNRAHSLHRNN